MKKFLLLGSTLLLSLCMIAQTPVAYYPFSGNANDAVGSLNGVVNGATLTTDRFGNAGSAYSFDGVNDAISFAALPMNNTDNFTLMAWVNPALFDPANQFNKMIISLGPGNNGYNMGMGNNSGSGSGNELGGLYNLVTWLHSGSFFSLVNTWYHVALIRENGVTKFYMNAVLAPNTNSSTPFAPTAAFQIGGQDFDPTHYWNGKIDEVKIYNVALTALQVQQEYAASSQVQKPGSGNAINFDGFTQSVSIPNSATLNFGTNDFSVDFWYNSLVHRTEIIFDKRDDNCGDGQLFDIIKNSSGDVFFEVNVPGPTSDFVTIPQASDGKWHHIAFIRTPSQMNAFKDGILIDSKAAVAQNVNNSANLQLGIGVCGPFFPGGGFFTGSLDEIRIWNTALTQTQIRDRMCHKITSSDPLYNNLVAYYNFDESTGATVFDGTINANNGALVNSPSRTVSGAHIGNTSTHSYAGSASTTVLTHPTRGDALTATLSSGGADGVQLYCVTEDPNNTAGQTILSGNNSYFGVFPINGTATQYTATYNYSGIGLNANPENKLILYKRNDNAASLWNKFPAVLDSNANTLTATGQNTEYMIGLNDQQQVLKPGSGNAISFDGVDDVITVNNNSSTNFDINQDFTIDMWLKVPSANQVNVSSTVNIILEKWGTPYGGIPSPFTIQYLNNTSGGFRRINFSRFNGTTFAGISSAKTINDDKFHHLTFQKAGTNLNVYVDGILDGTAADLTSGTTQNNLPVIWGTRDNGTAKFNGSIDEVRIWNTALTQAQIRDRMCKKITSSDALYGNLVAYYNFDESAGTTVFDGTVNANNGTLANTPARVTSGAAIGNASTHDYVNATKTTSLSHLTGESFTVTSTSGSPDGIHVYRVDEQPNTLTGATGVGSNDKYFGVFQVGGTTPQYTAVYNYSGNPGVNIGNESQLRLNKRTDNAATTWSTLPDVPNEAANTITVTGESTEYILGKLGAPLPLNLVSFAGVKQNGTVQLNWITNNEINTAQFVIERSNGKVAFATIGTVQPLNISAGGNYKLTDNTAFVNDAVQYYRLKIIDNNGRFVYSNIIRLSNSTTIGITVFPNPAKVAIAISSNKKQEAVITNTAGQIISKIQLLNGSQLINVANWPSGIYFIKTENEVIKLIKE